MDGEVFPVTREDLVALNKLGLQLEVSMMELRAWQSTTYSPVFTTAHNHK